MPSGFELKELSYALPCPPSSIPSYVFSLLIILISFIALQPVYEARHAAGNRRRGAVLPHSLGNSELLDVLVVLGVRLRRQLLLHVARPPTMQAVLSSAVC